MHGSEACAGRSAIALLTAKEIFDLVRDDLVLVEEELTRQSAAAFEPVAEITSYLLGGGGKRLRPALLLLSQRYAGQNAAPAPFVSPRSSNCFTAPR